jgi:hypothetical protein
MTFLHPALLWALPFALAPIAIYYLMRYRSLRVRWGANYVLERALARFRKRVYLEQILLLTLRTLAAAAIVLAFARPASKKRTSGASDAGVHHLLVVDGSASMQAGEPGNTRWDRALEVMNRYVDSWGRGERWSLCLAGEQPQWRVQGETHVDPARTRALLATLAPGQGAVSWARILPMVRDRLKDPGTELILVSDDQATAWADMEKNLAPSAWPLSGYWVNAARSDCENSAVLQARFGSAVGVVGEPCRLYVDVRHFGQKPMDGLSLEVLRDGAFYSRESISLLPDQTRTLPLDVVFDDPGSHYVAVRLGRDALIEDNRAAAGIDIRPALRVMLLRDAAAPAKLRSAWPLLDISSRAWRGEAGKSRRSADSAPGVSPVAPVLKEGAVSAEDLASADVVVLDGERALSPELGERLRDYVLAGGALLLAPDSATDVGGWNRILAENRLLPAPLIRFRSERLAGERFESLTRSDWPRSAMRLFETEEGGDIANVRFYSWFEFGTPNAGVEIVKTFADRSPFLMRQDFRPGAVLMLAGGLTGAGGNLLAREVALPYVLRLFTDAAAAGVLPRVVGQNEAATLCFQPPPGLKGAAFQIENNEPTDISPRRVRAGMLATASVPRGTWGLGAFLLLKDEGVSRVWVGLQGERPDSDLRPLTAEAKARLTGTYRLTEVVDWPQLDEKLKSLRAGGEFHHWVILALLLCLLGEMIVERRFI